jgi:hypothetical protein
MVVVLLVLGASVDYYFFDGAPAETSEVRGPFRLHAPRNLGALRPGGRYFQSK